MRLLSPVLRGLIKLLPLWMRFIDRVGPLIATLAIVPSILWRLITDLGGWFASLPGKLWQKFQQLAGMIWTKFKSTFPGLASAMERLLTQSNQPGRGPFIRDTFDRPPPDSQDARPTTPWGRMEQSDGNVVNIDIMGGLEQFISQITRNGRFDWP